MKQPQKIKKVIYEIPPIFILQPCEVNKILFGKQKQEEKKKK
jgi:hypothetical protein